MSLPKLNMILMVKGMMSCHFVLGVFCGLHPKCSNLASEDGCLELLMAVLKASFLQTMSRFVHLIVLAQ